ncbi:MAG: 6-carboxytetrahydropterin synthase QueD [Acidobacteriota bacterium]
MYEVTVEQTFAAAHFLRNYGGSCNSIHGHNFRVQVTVEGTKLNEIGMLADFRELKTLLREVMETVDHKNLNEVPPFDAEKNPTTENLAEYFYCRLSAGITNPSARIKEVCIWETDIQSARYRP